MNPARGFAIVSAIFILVVLAALGAFVVSVSTTQQVGSALDVQGVRAYQAARAGLERGLYLVLRDSQFANNTATQTANQLTAASSCTSTNPAAPTVASFQPTATTLSTFVITVTCYAMHDNVNMGPWVYRIEATACNQPVTGWGAATVACPNTSNPGTLYVERRLDVSF